MRKRTGRRWAAAAGLTAAIMTGGAAQAAITYDFRWYASDDPEAQLLGSFSFTTADFIDARTELMPSQLDSCTVGLIAATCAAVALDPDSLPYDPTQGDSYDVVVFDYDQMIPSRIPAMAASGRGVREMSDVHYFEQGAFQQAGVYEQIRSDFISVLTVSGAPDVAGGVPEPSTWALMIAGFGLAGAGLRRRRPAVA